MTVETPLRRPPFLMICLLGFAFTLLALWGFSGWISHGPELFLAMAGNGLSWCF